jgi:hypothetical protein
VQATTLGPNLTGAALAPACLQAMNDAADELSPVDQIDTSQLRATKLLYIAEAEALGSVPTPIAADAPAGGGDSLDTAQSAILLDKVGERLAFERTGARLYDALLIKYHASRQVEAHALPPARRELADGSVTPVETPEETLTRIRAEELEHFALLCDAMTSLGGDPTAQTPCADVGAVASSGLMQVLNDPRTTLAQCLSAMLTAELTDNAGWELLITLAEQAGTSQWTGSFLGALAQEQEHLVTIKNWLTAIVAEQPRPAVV